MTPGTMSFSERLYHLADTARRAAMALEYLEDDPNVMREAEKEARRGLENGEFAIGDWIVRPRFGERQK